MGLLSQCLCSSVLSIHKRLLRRLRRCMAFLDSQRACQRANQKNERGALKVALGEPTIAGRPARRPREVVAAESRAQHHRHKWSHAIAFSRGVERRGATCGGVRGESRGKQIVSAPSGVANRATSSADGPVEAPPELTATGMIVESLPFPKKRDSAGEERDGHAEGGKGRRSVGGVGGVGHVGSDGRAN